MRFIKYECFGKDILWEKQNLYIQKTGIIIQHGYMQHDSFL